MVILPELQFDIISGNLPLLEEQAMDGGENWPMHTSFSMSQKKDWKLLADFVNPEFIVPRFVNVELDETQKIIRGTTGMTTLNARKYKVRRNGIWVVEYEPIFLDWQTLSRMYRCLMEEYEPKFAERSLDALCIAGGNWDGVMGYLNDMRPGDFPHHW